MKKNKYNINLNSPEPSRESVQKHKDFDALLETFHDQSKNQDSAWAVRIRKIGLTAVITIAAALLVMYFGPQFISQFGPNSPVVTQRPYVNPPLQEVQAKFAGFEIDAYNGGTYEYESGSKIVVPPGAFVDFEGNPVVGVVEMEYREFHDPVDFFLSGIPMEYDSAGVRFNLESAGMMELYAKQDGKRLNMKPGAEIDIQLISAINSKGETPDFNVYRLDVENRNWVYMGKDRMVVAEGEKQDSSMQQISEPELKLKNLEAELGDLLKEEKNRFAALETQIPAPAEPNQPRKANEKGFIFDFEINKNEFPDLAVYENVMWEVVDVPENDFFHVDLYDLQWDDVIINEQAENNYRLTLTRPDQSVSVLVAPVLTGSDYIKARNTFNEKFSVYEEEKSKRDKHLAAERKLIEEDLAAQKAMLESRRKELERELDLYRKSGNHRALAELVVQKKVINHFSVNNMGVWNCDRPLPIFKYNCNFTLVNREGQQYLDNAAYFLDKSLNTVHRFYASSQNTVGFDERSENLLWLVTNEGKIAIFRPEEFKKLERKPDHILKLDLVDKAINSEKELREILAL